MCRVAAELQRLQKQLSGQWAAGSAASSGLKEQQQQVELPGGPTGGVRRRQTLMFNL